MRCTNCEKEFDEKIGDCPQCGAVPELKVQILESEDRKSYTGVTIDQEGNEDRQEIYNQKNPYTHVHVKHINFSSGILTQVIGLIVIAIFIFVLLPAFLVGFLVVAAIWFVYKLLFR